MRPWTEEYYDIVDFYFWSPDKLGHRSDKERKLKKADEVMGRLKRIEEPLNHILGIFFALAPSRFVHDLFATQCDVHCNDDLTLLGRDVHTTYGIADATQPDFAFDGPSSFLTIEAKFGAGKSSLEQLLKYALLHDMIAARGRRSAVGLLYLSDGPTTSLFPTGFQDWSTVKELAIAELPKVEKHAFKRLSDTSRQALIETLRELPIAHCSYRDLDALLARYEAAATSEDAGGVEAKLYRGLRAELARRGVAG